MSPTGHALQTHCGEVCRSELQRLHKKTASLTPEDRAEVHALTLELAERMALRLDAALASAGSDLERVVNRLFALDAVEPEDR
jgi:hypothetical protein